VPLKSSERKAGVAAGVVLYETEAVNAGILTSDRFPGTRERPAHGKRKQFIAAAGVSLGRICSERPTIFKAPLHTDKSDASEKHPYLGELPTGTECSMLEES